MSINNKLLGFRMSPPAKTAVLRCHTSDMMLYLQYNLVGDEKDPEEKFCYFDTCNYLKNVCNNISKGYDVS